MNQSLKEDSLVKKVVDDRSEYNKLYKTWYKRRNKGEKMPPFREFYAKHQDEVFYLINERLKDE